MPDAITLPARPQLVAAVRRLVAGLLDDCPRADDAVLVASEYASNALRHSASRDGGVIRLVVEQGDGWARLQLTDAGQAATAYPVERDDADEYGRGLMIVDAVADKWGHTRELDESVHWAEFTWQTEECDGDQ
jgi:anti-sigma regulatory factor (Ser/Thr protein kinase)